MPGAGPSRRLLISSSFPPLFACPQATAVCTFLAIALGIGLAKCACCCRSGKSAPGGACGGGRGEKLSALFSATILALTVAGTFTPFASASANGITYTFGTVL